MILYNVNNSNMDAVSISIINFSLIMLHLDTLRNNCTFLNFGFNYELSWFLDKYNRPKYNVILENN